MRSELYQISEKELDEFDQLYDGTIDEDAYYIIMAKMQLDEILKHKYLVYKLLRRELEEDALINKTLKTRLSNLNKANKSKHKRLFALAIFSIIFFGIMLIIFLPQNSRQSKIYVDYKDSEAGISIMMGANDQDLLRQAMISLANNEYDSAAKLLNDLPKTDTVAYYIGYCNERIGETDKAEVIYNQLRNSNSTIICNKSVFRLALVHIKLSVPSAKDEMTSIAKDSTNSYSKLAKQILLRLNE